MKGSKRFDLLVISLLSMFAWSTATFPQTRKRNESLPKLLSVREQQALRESWLKKRLDTMLLPMMRQQKIEMWIVTNEEFHEDPVTSYIAPPLPYVGRRDFFIFADRGGDKLDRLAVVRYPEESLHRFFEVLNPPGRDIAATLRRIVEERKPKTIALNMMEDDAYLTKDGMKWFRPRQTAFYLIR
jgi:Xaa-Pro dipeptidase